MVGERSLKFGEIEIRVVPMERIDLDWKDKNPNEMLPDQFQRLVDAVKEDGLKEFPMGTEKPDGRYRLYHGHWKFQACQVLGFTEIPIVLAPKRHADEWENNAEEMAAMVKHNVLRGGTNVLKLAELISDMKKKWEPEKIRQRMGMSGRDALFQQALDKLIEGLPPELKKKARKEAANAETVQELSQIIHRIMREYGNTLQHGFIFFSFGGQMHLMVQMDAGLKAVMEKIATACMERKVPISEVIGKLVGGFSPEMLEISA